MKNENGSERGIDIIWNYVRNDYSWKDSYFKHFTKGQKFLFFLPVIFLFLPVYGTYELFYNHSWTIFILLGLGMLFSIWWFHKQKEYFEKKVIAKYYQTHNDKDLNNYHKRKLSETLGELNTKENRSLWQSHFNVNIKKDRKVIGLTVIFTAVFFTQFSAPYKQDYLLTYYLIGSALMPLLMTVVFIMPAFVNFKIKRALYNQAHRLVLELDKEKN